MVFKKIIFQNSLMANETPSRPPHRALEEGQFRKFFLPLNQFFWIPIENLGMLGAD